MMGNAQLAQSFENSIGSGLLTDTLCFMFTNSDIDIRKEMPDKGLCGSHHLIAHYRQLAPSGLEFMKQFGNTVVRTGRIERVLHIVLAEGGKDGLELRILGTIGYGTFHQQADTIAHKAPDGIY